MNKRIRFLFVSLFLLLFACNLPSLTATHREATNVASTEQQADATATSLAQEITATAFAKQVDDTALAQSANATGTAVSLSAVATAQAANATAQAGSANATSLALLESATAIAYASTATAQARIPTLAPTIIPEELYRISFPTGATSAVVSGMLQQSIEIDYVLRALQSQTMIIYVDSPAYNVYLGVTGLSDGNPFLRPIAGSTQFTGVLPLSQDYRLTLVSPYQDSPFNMQVIIPVRIKFSPGAISATEEGKVIGRSANHYLLKAKAGQSMKVVLSSPRNDVFLTIYGMQDGTPLVRSVSGETKWTGILPGTQDYMLEVDSFGGTTRYTLQVTVQ